MIFSTPALLKSENMLKQRSVWYFAWTVSAIIFATSCAWADDLNTEPFEVRLWLAMSRAVSSTDAIGREASVAYRSASSDNPAAADTREVEPANTKAFLCAGTHHIMFTDGAWIAAADANGFIRMKNAGTVGLGYVYIGLHDGPTRQGFDDDFYINEFRFKYGRQIRPDAYVGVGMKLSDLKLNYGELFQGMPRNTQDHSIAGSFTLGGLWRPNQDWTIGVLAEAGWIHSDIEGMVRLPGPFDAPFQFDLMTHTVNIKGGIGWRVSPLLDIYSDVQYFLVDNSMSTVDIVRFYFGGDFRLARWISLMAGSSVDSRAQASTSVGASIKMSKSSLLKVTYQYNPLPEIRQEFGTGNLISASVVFNF
jgi:hypothetical protein